MNALDPATDRLDAGAIAAALGHCAAQVAVEVRARCGSTNSELIERTSSGSHALLLAADAQSAGRGRRGRRWISPPGAGATFSILRRMSGGPGTLAGLSLAVGVAAARALRGLGVAEAALKWPNDLLVRGAKLGGVLIETRPCGRDTTAVVGIGINCHGAPALAGGLRRRVAVLDEFMRPPPARSAVIGAVAREVLAALDTFERAGLAAFAEDWRALHAYEGSRLRVRLRDGRTCSGIASGLAPDGALQLRTRSGLRAIADGSVLSARAP